MLFLASMTARMRSAVGGDHGGLRESAASVADAEYSYADQVHLLVQAQLYCHKVVRFGLSNSAIGPQSLANQHLFPCQAPYSRCTSEKFGNAWLGTDAASRVSTAGQQQHLSRDMSREGVVYGGVDVMIAKRKPVPVGGDQPRLSRPLAGHGSATQPHRRPRLSHICQAFAAGT